MTEPGRTSRGPRGVRWAYLLAGSILAVSLVAGAVLLAINNLSYPALWFDEAGQYWLSQGQYHLSVAGSDNQSILTGLGYARNGFNLDPPGFTALLAVWVAAFGSSPAALRALPFVLYIAALGTTLWFGVRILGQRFATTALICALALSSDLALYYAFEVRAFSMEMLVVLATAALTVAYLKVPSLRNLIALSLMYVAGAVFSRYTYIFAALASVATVILARWIVRRVIPYRHLGVLLGTLTATIVGLVWYGGLLDPDKSAAPWYTQPFLIANAIAHDGIAEVLRINFLTVPAVFVTVLLLAGLVLLLTGRAVPGGILRDRDFALLLWTFVVVYELVAIVASLKGATPWNTATRWSIGLTAVAVVAGLGVVAAWRAVTTRASPSLAMVTAACTLGLAIMVSAILLSQGSNFRHVDDDGVNDVLAQADLGSSASAPTWLVDSWLWPSFRYLVERSGEVPAGAAVAAEIRPVEQEWDQLISGSALCTGEQPVVLLLNPNDSDPATIAEQLRNSPSAICRITTATYAGATTLTISK